MKKIHATVLTACLVLLALSAQAAIYTFTPSTSDLGDLPHGSYFTWGLKDWIPSVNEQVQEVSITFSNIKNNAWTSSDHLYVHFLDTVTDPNGSNSPNWRRAYAPGYSYKRITISGSDDGPYGGNNGKGDKFSGQGVLIGDWTDKSASSLTFYVPKEKLNWAADGNWGFGIDPDCHYVNCGVTCKVVTGCPPDETPNVPEPASMLLGAMGLGGIVAARRYRVK